MHPIDMLASRIRDYYISSRLPCMTASLVLQQFLCQNRLATKSVDGRMCVWDMAARKQLSSWKVSSLHCEPPSCTAYGTVYVHVHDPNIYSCRLCAEILKLSAAQTHRQDHCDIDIKVAQALPTIFAIPKPHAMYCGRWYKICLSCVGALLQRRGRVGVTLPIWVHTRRSIYLRGKHQTAHMVFIVVGEGESAVQMLFSICPPAQADMHNHALYMPSG